MKKSILKPGDLLLLRGDICNDWKEILYEVNEECTMVENGEGTSIDLKYYNEDLTMNAYSENDVMVIFSPVWVREK